MASSLPTPPAQNKPKLLDQVRERMRLRHYSIRTEEAYISWIRRYILFHGKRHPRDLGEPEVAKFLTSLATDRGVAASTQNQALNALLFLYKEVLHCELGFIGNTVRAKRPPKLPIVLSREEVQAILGQLKGKYSLMAQLLYGSGLRLLECLRLRVKDLDLHYLQITLRDTKGGKERRTMLPVTLAQPLAEHLEKVKQRHARDLAEGFGQVHLPDALEKNSLALHANGYGSKSFRPTAGQSIRGAASREGTTSTRRTSKMR
jgi:integron integrase